MHVKNNTIKKAVAIVILTSFSVVWVGNIYQFNQFIQSWHWIPRIIFCIMGVWGILKIIVWSWNIIFNT